MKINGSVLFEQLNSGSETLESAFSDLWKERVRSENSSLVVQPNSLMKNESSSDGTTESDHCLTNEGIGSDSCKYGYNGLSSQPVYTRDSYTNLPSPSVQSSGSVSSFRCSFPPPPSCTGSYMNISQNSFETFDKNIIKNTSEPHPLPNDRRYCVTQLSSPDVNDNCAEFKKNLSSSKSVCLEEIEESEKHQLEIFFRSLKSNVFVCGSLVNLYFGWKENEGNWIHRYTGVIVVILDLGDTRSRIKRKIQIVLAERGTCFPLWKDTIDNLSAYHKSGTAFHKMHLSSDHRQIVGLSFDSPSEADKLIKHIDELTSNPENINISVPSSKKKMKDLQKKKPAKMLHKKQISNPCLFQHVTSIAARDKPIYMSLRTLIDSDMIREKENIS